MSKVAVLTAPRSGTHLLVRSISKSLSIPHYIPYFLDRHYPVESSWVLGSHSNYSKELEDKLKEDKVVTLVISRDPLDRALSCLAFTQFPFMPNSSEFFEHVLIDVLNMQAKEETHWAKVADLHLSYESLVDVENINHKTEVVKLETILNTKLLIESPENTSKKTVLYSQGSYAKPGAWKKVFSKSSVEILCEKLKLDKETYLNEKVYPTADEGNSFFVKNYELALKAVKDPKFGPPPEEPPVLFPPAT